jgi:hypothetical protein
MDLGRFDHALEVLGDDASPEAREVRAIKYVGGVEDRQQLAGARGAACRDVVLRGEELQRIVADLFATPPSAVQRLKEILAPLEAGR